MTCQEIQRLVMPYIRDELSSDELIAFMEHVKHCRECREELEIYFMVDVGLRQLDEGSGAYNIVGQLERKLETSRERLHGIRNMRIFLYAINTLGMMSLIVSILLQCRIWWQYGIL